MKAAIYARVSSEDQKDNRTIENQVNYAKQYFKLDSLDINYFYIDDGYSGTIPLGQRPERFNQPFPAIFFIPLTNSSKESSAIALSLNASTA